MRTRARYCSLCRSASSAGRMFVPSLYTGITISTAAVATFVTLLSAAGGIGHLLQPSLYAHAVLEVRPHGAAVTDGLEESADNASYWRNSSIHIRSQRILDHDIEPPGLAGPEAQL